MARISIISVGPVTFTGDSLKKGLLAILCILLVVTFVQFSQATSILNRPHNIPRRAILSTLVAGTLLLSISYGLQLGDLVIENSDSVLNGDIESYTGFIISNLTCNFIAHLLIFLCIFLISYDRVAAYGTGAPERRWTFKKVLDGCLLGITAILDIAYLATYGSARVGYYTQQSLSATAYRQLILTSNNINTAQGVFYILLDISVLVAAIMLYLRVRAAGAADEVAKTLLFMISPIIMIRALWIFISIIVVRVPAILPSVKATESYNLAQAIIGGSTILTIIGFLLRLGYRAEAWAMPPVRDGYNPSFAPGGPVAHNGMEGWKPPSGYQPPAMSYHYSGGYQPNIPANTLQTTQPPLQGFPQPYPQQIYQTPEQPRPQ